eukprot:gene2560-3522_t
MNYEKSPKIEIKNSTNIAILAFNRVNISAMSSNSEEQAPSWFKDDDKDDEYYEYNSVVHGANRLISGERINLVIWCKLK